MVHQSSQGDDAKLAELLEKLNAARSPGPWIRRNPPPGYASVPIVQAPRLRKSDPYDIEVLAEDTTLYETRDGDLEFIVALENAFPQILAALRHPHQPQGGVASEQKFKSDFGAEIYEVMKRLGASPDLLSIIGSYGDTLGDAEVLSILKHYNETGIVIYAMH